MTKASLYLIFISFMFIALACHRNSQGQEEIEQSELIIDPVLNSAEFPGGMEGLTQYLKANWKQPDSTARGKTYVEFEVLEDGSVSQATIKRTLCESCDREAIRLVESMPKWKPLYEGGVPKKQRMVLAIKFDFRNPY